MKIKMKEHRLTRVCLESPYQDEIGTYNTREKYACCGNCDRNIDQARFYKEWNYCPYCGEKIDWEEEDK